MALFGLGRKKTEANSGCCAGAPEATAQAKPSEQRGGIRVLGGGCARCHELESNARAAVAQLGLADEVQLITDFSVIAAYGVMSLPALVVDERVVACGKVLKADEIAAILTRERSR